ncbi:argininosuccinate lyase [Photorhabdus luminescens]|uniref:argininosuccinate lyase n=1 Tax=Photorhabdus luminescens TaxID=29488 RepID=UPI0022407B4E|nr:argininosuccinate lyase [Photorhabdus luminescens]MCW7761630.1 argininosuccinate lyase [Photorhabdus luminescens subsp. venezuelensis]
MAEKLWGGRFSKEIDRNVLKYTLTTDIDTRLIRYDIWGSMAHLAMLRDCKIVSEEAAKKIFSVLVKLYELNEQEELILDPELEDVHLNIESLVIQEIGSEYGGRLHTARSRNDQVVTDTRMYLRAELLDIQKTLCSFIDTLLKLSEQCAHKIAIGYTHLQPAQPISLAFWYSCYASMFLRDLERLESAFHITNLNVLGACALAGTSFPIDREMTSKLLGFDRELIHSLDATSSRDFALQTASTFAILMSNFSRLAEEIVIWNSHEFRLLAIDDTFATGSSIMPQKKNPVVAELVKGRVGRIYGMLMQLLTVVKGVTLGYNCDLQEDKPMLWDAIDIIKNTTSILHQHIENSKYRSDRAEELCWKNFSTVTELANYLVREKNIPFREAHRLTGLLTQQLSTEAMDMRNTAFVREFLAQQSILLSEKEIYNCVSPIKVMERQCSTGATGPDRVKEMIRKLQQELEGFQSKIEHHSQILKDAENATLNIAKNMHLKTIIGT